MLATRSMRLLIVGQFRMAGADLRRLRVAALPVVVVGSVLLVVALARDPRWLHAGAAFWVGFGCVLCASRFPFVIGSAARGYATLSASAAFALALDSRFGFAAAAVALAAGTAACDVAMRKTPVRVAGNTAQFVCSLAAGHVLLTAAAGSPGQSRGVPLRLFAGLWAGAAAFYLVNLLLVSSMHAHVHRTPLLAEWRESLIEHTVLSAALFACTPLFVTALQAAPFVLPLTLAPLLLAQLTSLIAHDRDLDANTDPLTDLPNRRGWLAEARTRGERPGSLTAVLAIDLNRFKTVNDTHGHDIGDELLRAVSARLAQAVRTGDVVARFGGDEFVVLLPAVADTREAEQIAARVQSALAGPWQIRELTLDVDGSVGVACGTDPAEHLLRRADKAMYAVKADGVRRG
jgi:diguanylate cyclase (GGDEF)-like protein